MSNLRSSDHVYGCKVIVEITTDITVLQYFHNNNKPAFDSVAALNSLYSALYVGHVVNLPHSWDRCFVYNCGNVLASWHFLSQCDSNGCHILQTFTLRLLRRSATCCDRLTSTRAENVTHQQLAVHIDVWKSMATATLSNSCHCKGQNSLV